MTRHSFNCFNIVWGQGNAPLTAVSVSATFYGGAQWSEYLQNEHRKVKNGHCKGRLRPEVQPLNLSYTIFHKKGTPFVYLLLTNGIPPQRKYPQVLLS